MGRNKIAAFDAPAEGENPNGFRRVGSSGIGKGGIGDQGDEGSQFNYGGNIAGAPWAPPEPDYGVAFIGRPVGRKR